MEKSNKIIKNKRVLKSKLSKSKVITPTAMKLLLGTYEGKVICLELDLKTTDIKTYSFKVSENCIKTIVAEQKHILASGNDEQIHIYDIVNREEKGLVMTYAGSVSKIIKHKDFLFVGGDDSLINIWRMSDFNIIHSLKGHSRSVNDFILHSNGKILISVSKDCFFMIWNTMLGKSILKYNLKMNCSRVHFGKKESLAFLQFDSEIWLINLQCQSDDFNEWIIRKIKLDKRIVDMVYVKQCLFVFHLMGEVKVFKDCENNENYINLKLDKPEEKDKNGEEMRTKLINYTQIGKLRLLTVVFSNNDIFIYDFNKIVKDLDLVIGEEVGLMTRFRTIVLKSNERLTSITSQIV